MDAPALLGITSYRSKAGRSKRSTKLAGFYILCNFCSNYVVFLDNGSKVLDRTGFLRVKNKNPDIGGLTGVK